MPKETSRTRKIKAAIAELFEKTPVWDVRQLRRACLGKFDSADQKEAQSWRDSIRRMVMQMQEAGDLIALDGDRIAMKGAGEQAKAPAFPASENAKKPRKSGRKPSQTAKGASTQEEIPAESAVPVPVPTAESHTEAEAPATEAAAPEETLSPAETALPENEGTPAEPEAVPAPPSPAPDGVERTESDAQKSAPLPLETAEAEKPATVVSPRNPKAKHMMLYLDGVLHENYQTEEQLIAAAIRNFGATGKQTNGIKGLVVQTLKERVKRGELEFHRESGYRIPRKDGMPVPAESEPKTETFVPDEQVAEDISPKPTPESPDGENLKAEGKKQTPERLPKPPEVKTEAVAVARPRTIRHENGNDRRTQARRIEAISALQKKESARQSMDENRYAEKLNKCGGGFFTEYIARLFEAYFSSHGQKVCGRYVVDGSDDKGVDVILQTVDELGLGDVILLQAKTRASGQVTLKELREFFGVMSSEHATRGLFVTTSTFTTDAITFVRSNPNLAAIDKYKLFDLAREHRIGLVTDGDTLTADPALFG